MFTDTGNATYGFKDGANLTTEYTYDVNGNMKTDANKNISAIQYNYLNLPTQVTINGQNILYVYDATGVKLRKTLNTTTTDYAGNFIYENNVLQFFTTTEGYFEPSSPPSGELVGAYVYQYKDHLGNIRLSYSDANHDGYITASTEIKEENNYYPFGLEHKGYNNVINGTENNYKTFQGQEINKELDLNWLSFKYRNYDPAIGRFMSIDPLAEDYVYNGTYNFAENKVISHLELEGLEGIHSSKVDGAGIRTHIVQKNVIVLTQAPRPVNAGASPQRAAKIERQNARIAQSNVAKVDNVKSELKSFYSGAKNSAGETVNFDFNVTAMEVENTNAQPSREMTQIALDNGIESSTILFDGGAEQTAPAAIISTAGAGGSQGITDGIVVKTNSGAPDGAKSHEIGHTLKLKDNYSGSGVMASPPNRVLSSEVDEIIKKSYAKKDE